MILLDIPTHFFPKVPNGLLASMSRWTFLSVQNKHKHNTRQTFSKLCSLRLWSQWLKLANVRLVVAFQNFHEVIRKNLDCSTLRRNADKSTKARLVEINGRN